VDAEKAFELTRQTDSARTEGWRSSKTEAGRVAMISGHTNQQGAPLKGQRNYSHRAAPGYSGNHRDNLMTGADA
jgi:hypothetical protein